jgi:hypothetical protein
MSKYAIPINEKTLDLIQVLNGGMRPLIEKEPTSFLFDAVPPATTENHTIELTSRLEDEDTKLIYGRTVLK